MSLTSGNTRILAIREPTMVMMRAGGLTVEVHLHSDTVDGRMQQHVRVKDRGYVVYTGPDLARAQSEAESAGLPWADLEVIDEHGGAAAAG
ncbi:hypothetical protein [Cryptosporangium sp. NPDC048952]|uniref:hypothetical protein n=1 Tax=Cryptosporangium sp. NPDC048952 TaxID=3363961 RepID=UPI003716AFC4